MEFPNGLGGVSDSASFPQTLLKRFSQRESWATRRLLGASRTFFLFFFVQSIQGYSFPREMRQTNRQLSRTEIWPRTAFSSDIEAREGYRVSFSRTLEPEASHHIHLTKNATRNRTGLNESDHANANSYGSSHTEPQVCNMDKQPCQPAAPEHGRELNADARLESCSTSDCATISRELCKAVSVSLGLAMDSSDISELDPYHACTADDQIRGNSLFGVSPPICPGTETSVSEYIKCHDRYDRPLQKDEQLVEIFRSSEDATTLHYLSSTLASVDEQEFRNSATDDTTSKVIDHLDIARAASCPYVALMVPENFAHLTQTVSERPPCLTFCKPPGQASDIGEAMEGKYADYLQEQYSVKIKSEAINNESAGTFWDTNYSYNENGNSQFGSSRQYINTRSAVPNTTFMCSPYERSVIRERPSTEQWYASTGMPPYPNHNQVKKEVGDWLDVSYNDAR